VLIIYGLRLSMKMGKYTSLKTFTDMTPNWSSTGEEERVISVVTQRQVERIT